VDELRGAPFDEQVRRTSEAICLAKAARSVEEIEPVLRRFHRVCMAHVTALRNYVPRGAPPRTILFAARDSHLARKLGPTLGWAELGVVPAEVQIVPGDHETMLEVPHVGVLATKLGKVLGTAP
jgi:thioesterase domain-containing protein